MLIWKVQCISCNNEFQMNFPNYMMMNTKEIFHRLQLYKCDYCGLDEFRILEVTDLPSNRVLEMVTEKIRGIQEILEGREE